MMCLGQLYEALTNDLERLRAVLVNEVGAPVSSTSGPRLGGPIDVVRWYADLLGAYEFVEDLGERDTIAGRHHRWIEKEAAGVVTAITAYNYPIQLALAKLAPALAAGCTVVLKGTPDTPWSTLALGRLVAESTDIPPGVVLIDRDEASLRSITDELAHHAEVVPITADITDPALIGPLTAHVEGGSLRAVAHAAGVSPTMASWREIVRVDLIATALIIDALSPFVTAGTAAAAGASARFHRG